MPSRHALALAAALALPWPTASRAAEAIPPAASVPAPAVSVVAAVEREVVQRAVVSGTLVPRDEILVTPEVEGFRVTEVLVEEGDRVARGQVLARLSREMLDVQILQNRAAIARAEGAIAQARSGIIQSEAAQVEAGQALERTRSLIRTGNATEVVLEQRVSASRSADGRLAASRNGLTIAQAELAQSQAQQDELTLRVARTEIRAPEAGIVSRRAARVGASASAAGEPLFRLIARGEIELEGDVPETELTRIAAGAPASLATEGAPLVGRVRAVYPEVDRATRLGKVRIALPADPRLRVGAFARGTVEVARRSGVVVPVAAVVYGAAGAVTVLAVRDGRVEARSVRTGLSAEGVIEIREGVAAGEPVVARAGSFLRDGDRVRPVVARAAAALP